MPKKIIKYTIFPLFAVFLLQSVYYSYLFHRADGLIYSVYLSSFFFICVMVQSLNRESAHEFLFYILFAASVIFTSYGFFSAVKSPGLRLSGLLGDRAYEADAAVGLFVYFSAMFLLIENNKVKITLSGTALFLSFAYLSLLRVKTAYAAIVLCLIAVILIIIILQLRKGKNNIGLSYKRLIMLAILILSSIFAQTTVPFIQPSDRDNLSKSIKAMFDLNNSTNSARIEFWNASLKMFSEHPVTGIGAGMWPGVYPEFNGTVYTDANVDMNSAINPHNDYLRFISEFGISGIFYFLFAAGSVLILFYKSLTEKKSIPFLFTSICYFITSIFNFTYDNIFAMMLFLFSLSTAYAGSNSPSRTLLRIKWPLSVLITVAIIFMFIRVSYQKDYETAIQMKFRGDYNEAAVKLESINDVIYPVDPNKIPVSYYLGTSYFELKNYPRARFCFERASSLMPFYPSVMENTIAALYKDGNVGESIKMYKKMREIFPNFFEPQINLLSIYANEKMNLEAKNLINDLNHRITEQKFIKNYIVFLEIKNYYLKNGL